MDRMHAPWRIDYIKEEKQEGCIFCLKPPANNDGANLILARGEKCFAIMNKFPYTNGHLMVAPYEHIGEVEVLPLDIWQDMLAMAQWLGRAMKQVMKPHGFNLGVNVGRVAGAGMDGHLHLHIVPRWNGDVNFMPVLADCRVISEHIEASYASIISALDEIGAYKGYEKPRETGKP